MFDEKVISYSSEAHLAVKILTPHNINSEQKNHLFLKGILACIINPYAQIGTFLLSC